MEDTGHVTEKLTMIFFNFLGVFHRFSINIIIKIEVHLFFCIGKWKDSGRV